MNYKIVKIVCITCVLNTSIVNAETIETVFQDAARYTVKIETTTEHPYLNDTHGTVLGAGFLVDKSRGWVLTNRHVVGNAPSQIDVRFSNSKFMPAEKLYLDTQVDLALIQIPTEAIPGEAIEARLACNETPQMGNAVVIFGHPSGLNFTGTRGIISGTIFVAGNESLQTDAPLSSGNSGGPLISVTTGKVVGVSEATYDKENSEGLNLTVSIDHACKILSLIKAGRNPSPPELPIVFMEHDFDNPQLVVARSYYSDEFPLKTGDVIARVHGSNKIITNIDQLKFQLRGVEKSIDLVVKREGQEFDVTLPITPQPDLLEQEGLAFSGMTLVKFDSIDKSEIGYDELVIVSHVSEGSIAYNEWFDTWDSFHSVNGNRVFSNDDIYQALLPFNNAETEVNVVVRTFSDQIGKIFDYSERKLKVRDLKILAHKPSVTNQAHYNPGS